ncbi:hypothetical protein SASPL_130482 [Salvia splendens]|uniref:DM2 domain-containing protein n=1 Tax=Salvia splendens TaxID=180675 RepID=A0A8X8X927_SALSN|nr:hypothetical protein SASPL_130482 [Salvia splendens]
MHKESREEKKVSVKKREIRSYATFFDTESEPLNPRSVAPGHAENTKEVKPNGKTTDNFFTLDADAKRRVLTLMKAASSSVKLEDVKRRHKPPSQALYSRFSTDNVTMGKVEGSVQAVHAALKKFEEGNVRDAKAVCGEELLQQVLKWKEKLKIYLAPFLHGMRYTSFGRHFTKMDKLKESGRCSFSFAHLCKFVSFTGMIIPTNLLRTKPVGIGISFLIADILHWYVQDGDMLVDFCCGSNDFSFLMKEKLDEMGRVCSFKNYDILQAKNGKWLDEKVPPYDLIWEDDQILAGKCFISESHSHHSGALKNCRLDTNHNELHTTNSGQVFHGKSSSARGEDKPADTPKTLGQNAEEIALCHGEVLDNETVSHSEGLPGDINSTLKDLEQKEENINHRDELPHDINSSFRNLEQKEKATISRIDGLSRNINSSSTNLDKERKTISHKGDLPHSKGVGKSHAADSVGGREDKKRSPSNLFPKDRSSGKLKVRSERGERHQVAPVPFERGDRWQSRQVAGRDEHRQQQLSRGKFPTHQPYSQAKDSVEVSDLLKKYGAEEHQHGMRVEQAYDGHRLPQGQAYNAHHPPQHDMSGGQVYATHHLPQHGMSGGQMHDLHQPLQRGYDWRSSQGYASPAASVRSMGSPAPPYTSYSGDVRSIGSPAHPCTSYPGEMNVRRAEVHEWSREGAVPPYQGYSWTSRCLIMKLWGDKNTCIAAICSSVT